VTTIGDALPVPVNPPGLEVTVYEVIVEPPSETGAVNETVAWALPGVAEAEVGAPGIVAGVTLFDGSEAEPSPTAFVATTVNVYAVPLVRPDTTIGDEVPVPVNPPGLEVTVYEVTEVPPLNTGGVNEIVA
jgi:hypothetical protein